jgi:hypothetical protein
VRDLRTWPEGKIGQLALEGLSCPVDARHAAGLLLGLFLPGHVLLRLVRETQLGDVCLLNAAETNSKDKK